MKIAGWAGCVGKRLAGITVGRISGFVMVHGATAKGRECLQTIPGNDRRISRVGCTATIEWPKIKNHKTSLHSRPMPKVLAIPTIP